MFLNIKEKLLFVVKKRGKERRDYIGFVHIIC